ncbi:MAG: GIY-YIG nuclease family protein [Smithella sp.]|nr:GIY-YIG nuclease family protein [Smithella sp.]
MFYVYILQSETSGRYYIGQTDSLDRRLAEHNDPTSTSSSILQPLKKSP